MKIIVKCDPANLTWWHGRRCKCSNCDTVVQFEAVDVKTNRFIRQNRNELRYLCPTCPTELVVLRAKDDPTLYNL